MRSTLRVGLAAGEFPPHSSAYPFAHHHVAPIGTVPLTCANAAMEGHLQGYARIDQPRNKEIVMSKRARKRRSRKGKAANHGRKPNA